jgi:spore coat polysaccharide biosynthesis protein SpsF
MEALRSLPVDRWVVLTDTESKPKLEPIARRHGYETFAGHPENVLKRYVEAALYFDVERIVRATGDNPLVSAALARETLQLQEVTAADYAGITGTPYGTGVEVVRTAALVDLQSYTQERYVTEHVTPGLYRRPERYRVVTRSAADSVRYPEMRVTLDTPQDYEYIAGVFRDLYRGRPIELPELVAYGHLQQRDSA